MIEVRGSKEEIYSVIKGLAPSYPAKLIMHLFAGTWHFTINEVDVKVEVVD